MTIDPVQQDVSVRLDDRVRFIYAVLAITDWPVKAQARKPHGTHLHARATRKFLESQQAHPAVQTLQRLLNEGVTLVQLQGYAAQMQWPTMQPTAPLDWLPAEWPAQLKELFEQSRLTAFWSAEQGAWLAARAEAERAFDGVSFKPFLKPFLGEVNEKLIFIPSILFPANEEATLRHNGELICIAPPRLAWGDSPPWPFDEDPAYIRRVALMQYGHALMVDYLARHPDALGPLAEQGLPVDARFKERYPTWQQQFTALFTSALAALYLEQHVHKKEFDAYVLMERKMHGVTNLPGTISVLRRYRNDFEAGKYTSLAEFLPIFPKQLRVANKIVSL
jgi:hypothetical protein